MRRNLVLALSVAALTAGRPVLAADHGHAHHHGKNLPHPDDPVLRTEHIALLDLIKEADATHTAARDGAWSDPLTWQGGRVPGARAVAFVPGDRAVTVDVVSEAPLRALRVDGKLAFATDRDTGLVVDTLIVFPGGKLEMGTAARPVERGKRARLVIAGRGLIDTDHDPNLLGRGLLTHGSVSMYGAPVTSFVALATPPSRGDTRLVLAQAPVNWRKGDRLVLTGTGLGSFKAKGGAKDDGNGKKPAPKKEPGDTPSPDKKVPGKKKPASRDPRGAKKEDPGEDQQVKIPGGKKVPARDVGRKVDPKDGKDAGAARDTDAGLPNARRTAVTEDEELELLGVSDNVVTVRPLRHDHAVPAEGLVVYLANLTRNVVVESKNPADVNERGHVMFMHSPHVGLAYAGFYGLGRTNKGEPIDDPKLDERGKLVPGTGLNPRGRYAVHFHRTGAKAGDKPASVRGCAVADTAGWGFVNHSSNIVMEDNVAYDTDGAGFITEAGDELGAFRHNLAVRSSGSGANSLSREHIQDFGHEGVGFWLQGGGVEVEDNIAAGHADAGFSVFTQGLVQEGLGRTRFPAANLVDRSLAGRAADVAVTAAPLRRFKNNVTFASEHGYIVRFHLPSLEGPGRGVLEGGTVWNTRYGARFVYSQKLTLRGTRFIGNFGGKGGSMAFQGANEGIRDFRYEDLRVEGWDVGINVREAGEHVIAGGYYNNRVNVMVPARVHRDWSVTVTGDVEFGTMSERLLRGQPQYDVYMDARPKTLLNGALNQRDPNVLFWPAVVQLDVPRYRGKQVYYPEQAADAVPFGPDVAGGVPEELVGLTNRQMWEKYGLAFGGGLPPADARPAPRIHGLVGSPIEYPVGLVPRGVYYGQFRGARVGCVTADNAAESARTTNLHAGWNLVTLAVQGRTRSLLVFGGQRQGGNKGAAKKPGK